MHQFLRAIDSDFDSVALSNRMSSYVLVIGATNRLDAVDQALRRPGCFNKEIALGVPDKNARAEILSVLTRNLSIEGKVDCFMIARFTPGFVGADLATLVSKARNLAMKRIIDKRRYPVTVGHKVNADCLRHPRSPEENENPSITMLDFEEATKLVQPSTRRKGFFWIPNIKWEDVGGLDSLRKEFNRYIIWRIKHPKDYELLKKLDGANNQHGVYVIGATNRLELIDPAILQPGRFGTVFYVPLPSADERGLILKTLAHKKLVSPDFDYTAFTSKEACKNLTGADLAALVNEAAMIVKEEKKMHVDQGISYDDSLVIKTTHFDKALEKIIPSVSEEQRRYYETLAHNFSAT